MALSLIFIALHIRYRTFQLPISEKDHVHFKEAIDKLRPSLMLPLDFNPFILPCE